MVRALVSAGDVTSIARTHADRVHDVARRLGCTPPEAVRVTEEAAVELVEALARRPETVGDLVGGLFARARALALRARSGSQGPRQEPDPGAPQGVLQTTAQSAAVLAALDRLPEAQRFAALARDSYGLTPPQVSVAAGLEQPEAARSVALARIALVADVEGGAPVPLSGHDVAVGDLGQLADGTAPPGGRFGTLRRHVAGCAVCAAVLDVQTRGAAMLAALPLLALPEPDREQLLRRAAGRAESQLPSAEQVRREIEHGYGRATLISPLVIGIALLLALLFGGLTGALLARTSVTTGGARTSGMLRPAASRQPGTPVPATGRCSTADRTPSGTGRPDPPRQCSTRHPGTR